MERVWKIKYWSDIGYLKKFKYRSSRVRVHVKLFQKTLASPAKWSIDTNVWNTCPRQCQIFHDQRTFQHFYHVTGFKLINNIVFETGKYHSWPNTLPFWVGYWGANTCTPGSDPSTGSSPSMNDAKCEVCAVICNKFNFCFHGKKENDTTMSLDWAKSIQWYHFRSEDLDASISIIDQSLFLCFTA